MTEEYTSHKYKYTTHLKYLKYLEYLAMGVFPIYLHAI
jgi:hypothetical protein